MFVFTTQYGIDPAIPGEIKYQYIGIVGEQGQWIDNTVVKNWRLEVNNNTIKVIHNLNNFQYSVSVIPKDPYNKLRISELNKDYFTIEIHDKDNNPCLCEFKFGLREIMSVKEA